MPTRLICLDVDGTLTDGVGGAPLPGAVEACARLRRIAPVRLVTNTTSRPHGELAGWLSAAGLLDDPAHLVTPATAARRILPARGHDRGLLLAEPSAAPDFAWFREEADGPAVLLATEAHDARVSDLQPAFRALLDGAVFYTLQRNRYFRKAGELVTDLGPVAAFLSYASGREAELIGKPAALLYDAIVAEVGATRAETVMAGDDAEFDAAGATALGMRGVLVRTGKYRPGDELRVTPPPDAVLDSIVDLPAWLGH